MKKTRAMEVPPDVLAEEGGVRKGTKPVGVPQPVLAVVLVKTDPAEAEQVARTASQDWGYPPGDVYLVLGVRWSAVVADGEYVVLAMRAEDAGQLGKRIAKIRRIVGVLNPTEYVVNQCYKDGRPIEAGHDGMP